MRKKNLTRVVFYTILSLLSIYVIMGAYVGRKQSTDNYKRQIPIHIEIQDQTVDIKKPVIDLSGWNRPSELDYNKLAESSIGAIIRVQHGAEGIKANEAANQDGADTQYKTHLEHFQARGIPVAVYAYINGKNEAEMRKEARDFYARAKDYNPRTWFIDTEEVTMKDMAKGVEAFRDELKKLGAKRIGIYSYPSFLTENKISLDQYDVVWLATYGAVDNGNLDAKPKVDYHYDLHQYTGKGWISGAKKAIDLNVVTDQASYVKIFGKN
jgi:lysozyme